MRDNLSARRLSQGPNQHVFIERITKAKAKQLGLKEFPFGPSDEIGLPHLGPKGLKSYVAGYDVAKIFHLAIYYKEILS